mgnify:CR=1 FL=1|jgi:hypothetical protein
MNEPNNRLIIYILTIQMQDSVLSYKYFQIITNFK